MLWSKMFIPTVREQPSGAEAVSHSLLLRGGYIRQLTAGVYSLLPLAQRVRLKIIEIIRQEMNAIGGQEFLLSGLQPLELWDESGRTQAVSDVMFRLKDRRGSELALGLTHEEVFTSIARAELVSYRQVPQIWYQVHTKFRDEARPKGGLLRVREFTMKDSYSFDIDTAGLDSCFDAHHDAYVRIFTRCGLTGETVESGKASGFRAVQASSGAMGGSASTEFMVLTAAGEDTLVLCSGCDYAANVERAESVVQPLPVEQSSARSDSPPVEFPTPGIRTIRDLEEFENGAPAQRQIKTLVYAADKGLVIALVQGDQELNEAKLQSALGTATLRPAEDSEISAALGANPGSLGACGVRTGPEQMIKMIIADHRLRGRLDMVTGANKNDFHLRNVSVDQHISVDHWTDLHTAKAGENCIKCGGKLYVGKGLEIGHIFKLGTRYSESMNAQILGPDGNRSPIQMGSYGIGVERLMAAIVELSHDEQGLIWPLSVAPFQVLIVPVNAQNTEQVGAAERLYAELKALGVEVLFDDRDERAGVKFNDADLIGVPFRITCGKKVQEGQVEIMDRRTKSKTDVPIEETAPWLRDKL
jgi:prolyl-tRNA synthetase